MLVGERMWQSTYRSADAFDGHRCKSPLREVDDEIVQLPPLVRLADVTVQDYNSSNTHKFKKELEMKYWKDVNIIVTHGRFMRNFASLMNFRKASKKLVMYRKSNLFMLDFDLNGKKFVLVRHCARQYQKSNARKFFIRDPKCAQMPDGRICGQDQFEQVVRERFGEVKDLGIYCSIMRRAIKTAEVIAKTLGGREIKCVPFCREVNWASRRVDLPNSPVKSTLRALKMALA